MMMHFFLYLLTRLIVFNAFDCFESDTYSDIITRVCRCV